MMNNKAKVGLTVAYIALTNVFASAQSLTNTVQVTVDGNPVTFEAAQPQLMGGRVLVPLRGVFEQLGAAVDWSPDTQTVTVDGNGRHIRLRIGSFDAEVNGRVVTMDVSPQLIEDSTMVPLRFLSQSMGARVDWQPQNDLVAITTMGRPQRIAPPPVVQEPTPPPPVIINPPPVVVPPPTVIVQPPAAPAPPPAPEMFRVDRDYVIPMRLDVELTSNNNRPGDHFLATVRDTGRYWEFPEGTVVEGVVRDAIPAGGSHGGTLDLRFTHIRFPDGHRYPLSGVVVPLDSPYVIRTREGRFIARRGREDEIAQDAEVGAGAGLLVGAYVGKAVGGAAIGGAIGAIVGAFDHRMAHNVIFRAGTRFGLILGEPLEIDRTDLGR